MAGAVTKNMIVRVGGDFSGLIKGSKQGADAAENFAKRTKDSFKSINGAGYGSASGSSPTSGVKAIFGSAMQWAKVAAVVATVVPMIKKSVEAASDLAEVQNVVNVAFGNLAQRANEFARTQAEMYGLSELQAKQFSGRYMAMATSLGIGRDAAADMSIELTKLSGDVASFYNIKQEEAYSKLRGVFTGETEALKDLGVVMTQANLQQFALAQGISKPIKEMAQAETTVLRYAFVMDALSKAQGDFAATSTSWANSIRTLQNRFKALLAIIGKGFIAIAQPFVNGLNALLGAVNAFAQNVSDVFSSIFGTSKTEAHGGIIIDTGGMTDDVNDALNAISGGADKAADKVSDVGSEAKKAAKALGLMKFDQINKLADNSASSSSGSSGSSSGTGVTNGLSSITSAADNSLLDETEEKLTKFTGAMEKLHDWLSKLNFKPLGDSWDRLRDSAGRLADIIGGALKWGVEHVLAPLAKWTIEEAAPRLMDTFSGSIEILADVLEMLQPFGTWFWDNFLVPVAGWAAGEFTGWLDTLNGLLAVTDGVLKGIIDVIHGDKTFTQMLKDFFGVNDEGFDYSGIQMPTQEEIWGAVGGGGGSVDLRELIFGESWEDVTTLFDLMAESVVDFVTTLGTIPSNVVTTLSVVYSVTKEKIKTKWEELTAAWKEKKADLSLRAQTAAANVKEWWKARVDGWKEKTAGLKMKAEQTASKIKEMWGNATKWWKDKKAKLSLDFSASAAGLKSWINTNVIDRLNSTIAKVPFIGNARIPHLAVGGIATMSTLANIGENGREAVLPLDRNTSWMDGLADKLAKRMDKVSTGGGSSGGNTPIVVQVLLDGKVIATSTVNELNKRTRTAGSNGLLV